MKILCLDDEPLALKMVETCVKQAKPDAEVERELFAVIFEDEPYDKKLQNLLQTYIFAMMKSLKAIGAEEAVVRSYNALAVNVDVLDCDYYRFQELDAGAVNAYETEYMSQYSWADFLYNGY